MRRLNLAVLLVLAGPAGAIHAGTAFHDAIYGVSVTSDIVYGTGLVNGGADTQNLLLDIYQPTVISDPLPAKSPGIVLVHGGGWQSGSKTVDYAVEFSNLFASLGYVVASINYRLVRDNVPATPGPADLMGVLTGPSPALRDTINAGIEDTGKAMAWLRTNAATYNVDPSRIGLGGASAGAVNALAHTYDNPPPLEAPQAVLSFVGATAGTETLIEPGEPPALLINSDDDPLIPLIFPQATIAALDAAGIYNEFYVQTGGVGHEVDFDLIFDGKTLQQRNIEFMARFLVPEPSSWALGALAVAALLAIARRQTFRAIPTR